MLRVIFTLDYEIHGNGEGCPYALMVEPTNRMMDLFDQYGAKLTIMADMAEILKFGEYKGQTGQDDYYYDAIVAQLQDAIRRGHDVQLHLHPSYFNARQKEGRWIQDWSEYNFARLPLARMNEIMILGKRILEELLTPIASDYKCIAFRAANWSMCPSQNAVQALVRNGFEIDSSVFKHGHHEGLVSFDYREAPSALVPWKIDENNICAQSENGKIWEIPIYCEKSFIWTFLTFQRIYRACVGWLHRVPRRETSTGAEQMEEADPLRKAANPMHLLRLKYARKGDINQCSGRQLIHMLIRAEKIYGGATADFPLVFIGHSKLFTHFNGRSLKKFLSFAAKFPKKFCFTTLSALDLRSFALPAQVVLPNQHDGTFN